MRTGGLQLIWSYPKVMSVKHHLVGADRRSKEKKKEKKVVTLGIEPKTNGLLDQRSTN